MKIKSLNENEINELIIDESIFLQMPHGLKVIKYNSALFVLDSLNNKISFQEWKNENSTEKINIIQDIYNVTNHCYKLESIFNKLENLSR